MKDSGILEQIDQLKKKYEATGEDLSAYLDGLLHSDYLSYWDYIHLDTLLSLQTPRTNIPDEKIFIIYHQITELYFNLIIHEQEGLITAHEKNSEVFTKRVKRINRYFDHLIDSFDIMIEGMDREQFLQFRMALLPSSGFQSAQYRKIEINATCFHHLAALTHKNKLRHEDDLKEVYNHLYWKQGSTQRATGARTLALIEFEKKYTEVFIRQAERVRYSNMLALYELHHRGDENIVRELRAFDYKANVAWPLTHLKSAVRYLQKPRGAVKSTAGTNWQTYLQPKNQGVVFYPSLWTEEELNKWGSRLKPEG